MAKSETIWERVNEGGEGYDPRDYGQVQDRLPTRREKVFKTLQVMDTATYRSSIRGADVEIAAARKELEDIFFLEWTRDETVARRASWNSWVAETASASESGRISSVSVFNKTSKQGWGLVDLRKAIKHWKL